MKSFIVRILLCYFFAITQVIAQTAAILPQGVTQFLDNNGNPLSSGKVYFYIPNTFTFKTTWQDGSKAVQNTNPVTLDAAGRAKIYGDGTYRQVLKSSTNNQIWDAVTASVGTGGGTTGTGDGDLVGTIKPWAALAAPNQYAFAYGQELSRTTYAALFTAIVVQQPISCTSGSPIASGLSDTSQIPLGVSPIGAVIESTCFAPGSTVISKTPTTITLSTNSSVSTTDTAAKIFLYGNGNGSTTFQVPDLRGYVVAGRTNMGGVTSTNLTTTYYNGNPAATGAKGGTQSITLGTGNFPPYTPSGTVVAAGTISQITPAGTVSTPTITVSGGSNVVTQTGAFLNLAASGTLGIQGTVTATSSTPTFSGTPTTPTFTNGASTFTGTAQGGTQTPFPVVQPTQTFNYIIKITPDSNSADASGVTSLGLMTGDIACGTGLVCTGNIISASAVPTYTPSVFNVRAYGAVGNGSTNDYNAFLAAYQAMIANGGGSIYIPASFGCYLINTSWQLNNTSIPPVVFGDGPNASCITTGANLTEIVRIGPDDTSTTRVNAASFTGIGIKGASIGGTVAGLRIRNAIYSRFVNIKFESIAGDAWRTDANANSSDPLSQGNIYDNIYTLNSAGRGMYSRGVKSSIFSNLQFDASIGYGAYWDMENQTAGSSETTENIISNIIIKNGSSAGAVFSGIAKYDISNLDIYINNGPGILFRPTITGTPAAFGVSTWNNLSLRNNAGCIDTSNGSGAGAFQMSNISCVGKYGADVTGINIKGWFWSNLSNISVGSVGGSGIVIADDPAPIFVGPTQGLTIKGVTCIGQSQAAASNGIDIGGNSNNINIDGVYTNACAGTAGYEINPTAATISNVSVGNLMLNVNTAAHDILNPSRLKFFGIGYMLRSVTPTLVNSLPACVAALDGTRAFVTDNNTALAFGGAVTTGGANHHPVYCDGVATAWKQG